VRTVANKREARQWKDRQGVEHASARTGDVTPEGIPTSVYTVSGHRWTFQDKAARLWTENRLEGTVLNACAGKSKLNHTGEVIRNDLDEAMDAEYHLRVRDLPAELGEDVADTVVWDPPWSVFQSNEEYDGRMTGGGRIMAEAIHALLRDGGRVVGFGYKSTYMPADLGYERTELAVFTTIGRTKDYFGVVDTRRNRDVTNWA